MAQARETLEQMVPIDYALVDGEKLPGVCFQLFAGTSDNEQHATNRVFRGVAINIYMGLPNVVHTPSGQH